MQRILNRLGKVEKRSLKTILIYIIFWVVVFIGALMLFDGYEPDESMPDPFLLSWQVHLRLARQIVNNTS